MLNIPFVTWIANAAAGLTGSYGEVTRQAERADCSRQTIYDHVQKVQAAVVDAHDGGPTRAELIERNQYLRQENAQLLGLARYDHRFPPEQAARVLGHRRGDGAEPQPSPHPAGPDPRQA